MGERALEVTRLSKNYPALFAPPRPALAELSFALDPGEVVALIGPNGSGKSTLLRILSGLLLPTGGTARVAGRDVVADRPGSRREVGLAFGDDRGLSPRLTVRQNLRFFGALYGLPARETLERIDLLAERLEARALLDRAVRTLSSGERARAVLARALLHRPKVLLLDELTRSLDPGASARIRQWLRDEAASSGLTLLVATHDLTEVNALAARVLLLEHGRLVASGAPAEIQGAASEVFAKEAAS